MEYVHESWNILRTPQNLIESLGERNDYEFNKSVAIALLNLNSSQEVSTPLFQDYLEILFLNYPDIFIEILSNESCKEFGLGFIRLINKVGLRFIKFLNVNDETSARCILNILNFSIFCTPEDLCMNALTKLSSGLKFAALVASTRVYFENQIHDIRKNIQDKFFYNSYIPPTLMMSQFKKSIFSDSITNDSNYQKHKLIFLIIWNIIVTRQNIFLTKYLSKRSLILTFLHIISEYAKNPSLSSAYLLFYTFPDALKENISQIIEDIKQFENDAEEAEESYPFLKSDVIVKILTTEQFSEPQPSELIKNTLLYPKNITAFADKLIQLATYDNFKLLYAAAPSLIDASTDVIIFLTLQNQLSSFLLKLAQVCENSKNDSEFYQIWFLFLHYVQSSWSQGSKAIRMMVNSFLDKVTDGTRFLLTALITYKKPDFELTLVDHTYYFQRSIILFNKLLNNSVLEKFYSIIEISDRCPHFWPSIILYCICKPRAEYIHFLANVKFPKTPIVNALFNHFMFITSKIFDNQSADFLNKPAAINILKFPDYDIMIRYPSTNTCELKTILKEHIMIFITESSISAFEFNRIACFWRSWATTYGIQQFSCDVLDTLNMLTITISSPHDSTIILEKLALMFGCICEDDKENEVTRASLFSEILDKVFGILGEVRFKNRDLASGLGSFCVILISLIDKEEDFNSLFNKTFEFVQSCLVCYPNENDQYKIYSVFALSFIRRALFTPIFQEKIVEAPCDYLVNIKDWKTITDFFIVKARLNHQDD